MSGHPAVQAALPDSTFRTRLNPVEPPCYETRMPGGVGGAAPERHPSIPINRSRITRRRLTVECGNRGLTGQYGARVAPTGRNRPIDDRP
jgi:hypothetical protein